MDEGDNKNQIEFTEQDDKLRELLGRFSMSIHGDNWILYLWIIQTKCVRQAPSPINVNQKWYTELLKVRNNRDFRECYVAFKEVYDYLKSEFDDDLFTESMNVEYERRYNDTGN